MRIAALDVGSNSFHLIVVQAAAGGRLEVLHRGKEMVRLGEASLRTGVIPPAVFRRGLDALAALRRMADRYQPDALVAVATSAVREAQNGGEFVRAARDEVGVDIQVIRGQEEARLIYLGARSALDLDERRVALFDLGGGSLEVILADARECYFTDSVKLGVIRLTEEWSASDPPTVRELSALRDRVRRALEPVVARLHAMGFDFVAMSSGTASALAGLAGGGGGGGGDNPSAVKTLTVESLGALERRLAATTLEQRSQLPGLDPRRADTVLPGAVVLRTALDLIGASEATVCDAALREGIVADYIASHRPGILLVEEFPDLRRRSVMELARRCSFDEAHAQQVARLALSLFHQTRDLHGLEEQDAELLELAGLLHDIGFHISPNRHHHHAQYLIETHDMIGFSREEVQVIALAARYHRKAVPPSGGAKGARRRHRAFYRLRKRDRRRVRYLAALLRIADALDRSHARLVRAVRCALRGKTVELRLEVEGDPELELWAARRKGDLLESLTGWRLRLAIDAVADTRRDRASVAPATARGNEPSANPAEPTRRLRPPKVLAGKTPATRRTRSVRLVRPR